MIVPERQRRDRLTSQDKAEIVRLRTEERLSSLEIAARMGSNTTTVCAIVKPFPLTAEEMKGRKAKIAKKMRQVLSDSGHYIGGGDWTEEEEKLLKNIWPVRSKARILAAFPGRSWAAISRRASQRQLRRSRAAASRSKRKAHKFFRSLRDIREARGITREELADKAGFHRIQLAKYELGEMFPRWAMLQAWLGALQYELCAVPLNSSLDIRGKRSWLIDEENILRELLAQGLTTQEVALALKRPGHEVEKRAQTLGLLESEATRNVSGMTRRRLG